MATTTKPPKPRTRRSIATILIVTFLIAVAAALLYRAATGQGMRAQREKAEEERRIKELGGRTAGDGEGFYKRLMGDVNSARDKDARDRAANAGRMPASAPVPSAPAATPAPSLPVVAAPTGPTEEELNAIEARKRQLAIRASKIAVYERSSQGGSPADAAISQLLAAASARGAAESNAVPPSASATAAALLETPAVRALLAGQAQGNTAARSTENWVERLAGSQSRGAEPLLPRPALSAYTLHAGSIMPAVLLRAINADLPGQIEAMVTADVYDSVDNVHVLIPKGSKLTGSYNSEVVEGQQRLLLAFTRLRLPSGATVELGAMPVEDKAGASGLPAEVSSRFFRMFGSSFAIAALARVLEPRGAANTTNVSISTGTGVSQAAGQVLLETSRKALERNTAIRPTLTVASGEVLNVVVNRDMVMPPPLTRRLSLNNPTQ